MKKPPKQDRVRFECRLKPENKAAIKALKTKLEARSEGAVVDTAVELLNDKATKKDK